MFCQLLMTDKCILLVYYNRIMFGDEGKITSSTFTMETPTYPLIYLRECDSGLSANPAWEVANDHTGWRPAAMCRWSNAE